LAGEDTGIKYLFMDPKLVRERECADAFRVSVRTLRYWRRRKVIPFLKVGALVMYDLEEVLAALRAFTRETSPSNSAKVKRTKKTALREPGLVADQIKAEAYNGEVG
jgi:hypothetical protein